MIKDQVRWGILSTAQIARNVFIPSLRQTKQGNLVAIASRDRKLAELYASTFKIPKIFDDYTAMIKCDEIVAVYIPLPNNLHNEWSIKAANHGKHVFCEKPLADTHEAAEQMLKAAKKNSIMLFEAMVFRYHPQTLRIKNLLDSNVVGKIKHINCNISTSLSSENNIRWKTLLSGGALMDIGCYVITLARWAAGIEPTEVTATWSIHPQYGVDTHATILLSFPQSISATLHCGFDGFSKPTAQIFGTKGYIEIEQPTHPYDESTYTIATKSETKKITMKNKTWAFVPALDHFNECILTGASPILSASDALRTIRVMDAVKKSAQMKERVIID